MFDAGKMGPFVTAVAQYTDIVPLDVLVNIIRLSGGSAAGAVEIVRILGGIRPL